MTVDKREFYGETVQAAVDKATATLGISPTELSYSVVDEGSSGFLGIGARDARISVEVSLQSNSSLEERGPAPEVPSDENVGVIDDLDTFAETFSSEGVTVEEEGGEVEASVEEAPADLIVAVDSFATQLLDRMGFDATVDAYDAGEVIKVDIATGETGLLIGQKGETIDAIQYLLNVVVYKKRSFIKRIVVDTEGYRQRRVEALQGMAHRTARRAQREKRRLNLPPMAAAERRVVHLYLKENPNVSTTSEGSEEDRRVVIIPNE